MALKKLFRVTNSAGTFVVIQSESPENAKRKAKEVYRLLCKHWQDLKAQEIKDDQL